MLTDPTATSAESSHFSVAPDIALASATVGKSGLSACQTMDIHGYVPGTGRASTIGQPHV